MPFLVAAYVPPGARVLDFGCGYGRTLAELAAQGFRAFGVDPSERMLVRARTERPDARLVRAAPGRAPFQDGAFDAALLFTVLTCVPEDEAQRALVAEIARVLAPGGRLHVSDLLLNDDARNVARYEAARGKGLPYGAFELPEGAVCRHHEAAWIDALFAGWTTLARREFVARTMNGHESRAFQRVLARPAA